MIVSWSLTPCSLVRFYRYIEETCCLYLQGRSLLPWRWKQYFPPKCRLISTRLHGVTSLKKVFSIVTTLRTSTIKSLLTISTDKLFKCWTDSVLCGFWSFRMDILCCLRILVYLIYQKVKSTRHPILRIWIPVNQMLVPCYTLWKRMSYMAFNSQP
jgi:hypothetical protein